MKITLETPIKRDGSDDIKVVELLKPSTGQLRGIKLLDIMQMDATAMMTLLPRMTNPPLDPKDVAALDPADFMKLATLTTSFFGPKAEREELQAQLS